MAEALGHVEFVLKLAHFVAERRLGGIIQRLLPDTAELPTWDIALHTDQLEAGDARALFEFFGELMLVEDWFHLGLRLHLGRRLAAATDALDLLVQRDIRRITWLFGMRLCGAG